MDSHDPALLERLAESVGTPYWLYDAATLRKRIAMVAEITDLPGVQARFAMKSLPLTRVLQEMREAGIWIDAVSGNEVLRAMHSGYEGGKNPPYICFTADVFRDNALEVVMEEGVLPNIGSPGMIRQLAAAGYQGDISLRINPGFGHGHVNACDTGGPSSKHGVWFEGLEGLATMADEAGLKVVMLHSHIGSGPQFSELLENLERLADEFAKVLPNFPNLEAISLGGGLPHDYQNPDAEVPLHLLKDLFVKTHQRFSDLAGRNIRIEIEPGRFFVAPCGTLVGRVTDIKSTNTNEKGKGATFAMIDAGFVDLIRPAMYGSYHRIDVVGKETTAQRQSYVVAGPLCESGDVFTRDDAELLQPRELPNPEVGDLLTIHDGGAYGSAMSSNYNSIGRAPQLWLEEDGSVEVMTRRETLEDILRSEVSEKL